MRKSRCETINSERNRKIVVAGRSPGTVGEQCGSTVSGVRSHIASAGGVRRGHLRFRLRIRHQAKVEHGSSEGARTGSLLPLNDLTTAAPDSVKAVRDVVARYLQGAGLNDCGLQAAPTPAGTNMTWEYVLTGGGCGGTLRLKIERAYPLATTLGGNPTKLLNTRVTLRYPYQWKFNSVIQLMVPGGGTGVTEIKAASTMLNQS